MAEVATEVKLFNKWSYDDISVAADISLEDYIAVKGKAATATEEALPQGAVPHHGASCERSDAQGTQLWQEAQGHAHCEAHAGDYPPADGQEPLQVVVEAVIKSGPREDSTRVGSAGCGRVAFPSRQPGAVPDRHGAREASFRNVKTIAECLADELINASKGSSNSYAIKKKDEIERVAKANR
ncbi:Ribosomal protein S7 domain [Phytophthora cactorum]|nr:Ribosomal protein S7 domain [Phytophthora cactorum]